MITVVLLYYSRSSLNTLFNQNLHCQFYINFFLIFSSKLKDLQLNTILYISDIELYWVKYQRCLDSMVLQLSFSSGKCIFSLEDWIDSRQPTSNSHTFLFTFCAFQNHFYAIDTWLNSAVDKLFGERGLCFLSLFITFTFSVIKYLLSLISSERFFTFFSLSTPFNKFISTTIPLYMQDRGRFFHANWTAL